LNHSFDTTVGKNASSIKNITVFTPKNYPINREIRLTQRTQEYNVESPNTEKNHNHQRITLCENLYNT